MSDLAEGDVEHKTEEAFIEVFKTDDGITALFGDETKVDIIHFSEKKRLTLPRIAVFCLADQTVARTNEYHVRVQAMCYTQVDNDPEGHDVKQMVGAVRDCLHRDRNEGGFKGDSEGIVDSLNETQRGIVFHQVHEMDTDEENEGRTRKRMLNIDAWCFPGETE